MRLKAANLLGGGKPVVSFLDMLFAHWCDFSDSAGLVLTSERKLNYFKRTSAFACRLSGRVPGSRKASMCSLTSKEVRACSCAQKRQEGRAAEAFAALSCV